jgi:hypothetical protein
MSTINLKIPTNYALFVQFLGPDLRPKTQYLLYSSIATPLSFSLLAAPPLNQEYPPLAWTCQYAIPHMTAANSTVASVTILADLCILVSLLSSTVRLQMTINQTYEVLTCFSRPSALSLVIQSFHTTCPRLTSEHPAPGIISFHLLIVRDIPGFCVLRLVLHQQNTPCNCTSDLRK